MAKITKDTVKHMSDLAKIPISEEEEKDFASGFSKTLEVVDGLFSLKVDKIEPTHQVTGLENVLRDDKVIEKNIFSQSDALKGAKRKHNGYFLVDQILAED